MASNFGDQVQEPEGTIPILYSTRAYFFYKKKALIQVNKGPSFYQSVVVKNLI
jgi:hypothetical protein